MGYWVVLGLSLWAENAIADVTVITASQTTSRSSCSCPVISRVISCPAGYVMLLPAGYPSLNPTSYTQYSTYRAQLGWNISCDGELYACGHPEIKAVCAKVCN